MQYSEKPTQPAQRGLLVEFTLVVIPLIFILISIVELSRGMWAYSTLAFSVKRGARYAIVHGKSCASASSSCTVTIANVAQVILSNAMGLGANQLSVTLKTPNTSQNCTPLSACLSNSGTWPPATDNDVGTTVTITGTYNFTSALAMFWPGAGKTGFSAVNLGADASEAIAF